MAGRRVPALLRRGIGQRVLKWRHLMASVFPAATRLARGRKSPSQASPVFLLVRLTHTFDNSQIFYNFGLAGNDGPSVAATQIRTGLLRLIRPAL